MCVCQRDKREEALRLAQLSAEKPHFSHCLEWLLFTVFDTEITRYFQIKEGKLNESDFEHEYFNGVMSCRRSVSTIASYRLYIIGNGWQLGNTMWVDSSLMIKPPKSL